MATTNLLGITLLEQSQAQKEITINQALAALDAATTHTVLDKDLATPPVSPVAGDRYIVAASATGAWTGKSGQIAFYDQGWRFIVPSAGYEVLVLDESVTYRYNGTAWVIPTLAGGAHVVTSNAAQAFAVGANGATNPAFQVDASTASSVTGISVKSAASAGGVTVSTLSTATDESLTITSKGTSGLFLGGGTSNGVVLRVNGSNRLAVSNGAATFTPSTSATASAVRFLFTGAADTGLTAGAEAISWHINLGQTRQHATGAIALQRDIRITGTTHSAVAASTITDAAAFSIDGACVAGTNATLTNTSTIYSAGVAVGAGTTNSYALNLTANTGGTNNYIASFKGSGGEALRLRSDGQVALLATNTAAGTTGAQTINKPSGTVNFAAGASSLVVTNSLCTTASLVFAAIRTNDATAIIKNVVPAAGSFTITLNAAATAETSVGFFIIN